ncbi:hypothetical protein DRQ25_08740 [Candidatus Fermentibacteria bacterium]|nr:MAG: hypothetical protein DRQ25_08740 [Candidatus Fermentibacteria bacterium]
MPADWMDVSSLSFNTLMLLERVQLSWFPGWVPEAQLAVALRANPNVEWYLRHKCPELNEWLDDLMVKEDVYQPPGPEEIRRAEIDIMKSINDLIVYVVSPDVYDSQPFLKWNPDELTSLVDFSGKKVVDIGSGTGKIAFIAAAKAKVVYAVEPVSNLRLYLRDKAVDRGLKNIFVLDGLIASIPFEDKFADITICGYVFGDDPNDELQEMLRITKPGGMVILCPGNDDHDNDKHGFLVKNGFEWSRFEEAGVRLVRKYWKEIRLHGKRSLL